MDGLEFAARPNASDSERTRLLKQVRIGAENWGYPQHPPTKWLQYIPNSGMKETGIEFEVFRILRQPNICLREMQRTCMDLCKHHLFPNSGLFVARLRLNPD